MNKSTISIILFVFAGFIPLQAQVSINKLYFPYQNGYEFTMTDTTIEYDQYNFPTSQKVEDIRYTVKDHPEEKGVLIFQLAIFDGETGKFLDSRPSYLTLSAKGMSWWTDKSSDDKKLKITQAIKLPLKIGTSWKSTFSGFNATMACITTDTTLNTIYGAISCFGVSYEIIMLDDANVKYYMKVKEFYNNYAGKVHSEYMTYMLTKTTNKEMVVNKSWGNVSKSNLTEDQRTLIK